jgi:hypothetical protein
VRYPSTIRLRQFRLTAISVALTALFTAGPAHAVAINVLEFEANFAGGGRGQNLTDAEIATVIALNETALGIDIELIAKMEPGGGVDQMQPGFEGITFESFACTPAGSDCQTGFTLTLDFSGVAARPFQIVKLAVKAGNNLIGVFSLQDRADLQSGDLDVIQAAFVSSLERTESCGPSGCKGVSNILVFGARADVPNRPQQVPEPATLTLLGLGVVAGAVAVRRKYPKS